MEEMPSLVQLYQERHPKGLEILGVNLDGDPAQAIAKANQEFKIPFNHLVDPDGDLGRTFDVHAIPFTITLSASRQVLDIHAGDRNWMDPTFLKKLDHWLSTSHQTEADHAKR